MEDKEKTKERLIEEIQLLQRRITELEKSEFERKKTEELLRESEEKFRLAFENAKDTILWADPVTGTITNCNKAAEALLGKKREEIIGQHQTTIHPPRKAKFYTNMFKKHIEEKEAVDDEAEVITKSGEIKPVHISASVTLVGGKPIIQGIFRDITEYKRAEEELKESEEQFRSVTEQSPNMIFINRKGRVVYANKKSEEVMGYKREEFYSPDFDFLTLIVPEYRELVKTSFSKHMKGGEVAPYEYTLLTKEGKRIEVLLVTRLVRYGGESAILGIVTDITERKRAEEALAKERNLLRTVIDNLPDYIYIKDTDSRYIVSNKAHARFLGKETPEEVIGKAVFKLFPRKMAERYAADDQKIIQTGQPLFNQEEASIDRGGNKVWNLTTKVPLQDSDGKVVGLVGIARDITYRKRAEEALRESEERYRTLVQNVPVAVYRTTPGPKGKFLMGNPTCLKIFGLDSEEELKKIDVSDVYMNPEERKVFSDNLLAKGSVSGVELPLRRKDGTPFWGSVTARVVYDENGKNLYFDTTIIDITDRRRAEEERDALVKKLRNSNKKLRKMYAVKSDFASMVSHEVRTPLAAIKEGIGIVLDGLVGKINGQQKKFLDLSKRNVDRLGTFISQVLDFSKLEARKIVFKIREGDIIQTIKEVVAIQKPIVERNNLYLNIHIESAIPKIKFDPDRIIQVLNNLISNAIKFTETGGITISVSKDYDENGIIVCVKDTGRGIRKEDLPKLFQKFQQLQRDRQRTTEGTGLGLAISKEIIKQHNGKIWVKSKFGKGSEFKFILPIKKR